MVKVLTGVKTSFLAVLNTELTLFVDSAILLQAHFMTFSQRVNTCASIFPKIALKKYVILFKCKNADNHNIYTCQLSASHKWTPPQEQTSFFIT